MSLTSAENQSGREEERELRDIDVWNSEACWPGWRSFTSVERAVIANVALDGLEFREEDVWWCQS